MTLADIPSASRIDHPPAGDEHLLVRRILTAVLLVLVAWAAAIVTWGLPGLYLPAVALVPAMVATLALIAKG